MTDSKTATELLDVLRKVGNLHEFAELFDFDWQDESDWTWHDVAVKMADDIEQAIATTLGNGTCRNEWAEFGKFRCSECWLQVDAISTNTTQPMPIRYCPNCGRRVER